MTQENNTNFYGFTNRGIKYTVITKQDKNDVEVWTKTKAHGVNVKMFADMQQFSQANKTFNNFSKLLAA